MTAATDTELKAALANGHATLDRVGTATDRAAQTAVDGASTRLANAIKSLRWADTKYPDPMDLPVHFNLPDPWTFFNGNYQEYEADKKKRLGEEGAKPKRTRFKALK